MQFHRRAATTTYFKEFRHPPKTSDVSKTRINFKPSPFNLSNHFLYMLHWYLIGHSRRKPVVCGASMFVGHRSLGHPDATDQYTAE
jgi:hypothetical protein